MAVAETRDRRIFLRAHEQASKDSTKAQGTAASHIAELEKYEASQNHGDARIRSEGKLRYCNYLKTLHSNLDTCVDSHENAIIKGNHYTKAYKGSDYWTTINLSTLSLEEAVKIIEEHAKSVLKERRTKLCR